MLYKLTGTKKIILKQKLTVILFLFLAGNLTLLSGCGASDKNETLTKEEQILECTEMQNLWKNVNKDFLIGDVGIGEGNDMFKPIDGKAPVFTIYVNPLVKKDIFELYVQTGLAIDRHMGRNSEYLDYIQKNDTFYIVYDCLGETLCKLYLTGDANEDKLRSDLKAAVKDAKEEVEGRLFDFTRLRDVYGGINKADDGTFYYVVDSENVSDSLDRIMKSADELSSRFPYEFDEIMHWNDSFKKSEIIGGSIQIYIDKYGNEPLLEKNTRGFTCSGLELYNCVYSYFVPTEAIDDELLKIKYWSMYTIDGLPEVMLSFSVKNEGETLTADEIKKSLFKDYKQIRSIEKKHGIRPISEMDIAGSCPLTEYNGAKCLDTFAIIPYDTSLTDETDFYARIDSMSSYKDFGVYEYNE